MNVLSFLTVLAGLSFFLYGMSVMSSSLEKMAGGTLETVMKKVTSNAFLSFLLGTLITMAIQSSSGAMVMLIGLVNSGIIDWNQTLPIVLGTNVGTTVTGWMLTLTGIDSTEFSVMSLLTPQYFLPILAFVGILLRMTGKSDKRKNLGTIFLGFAILMYGMNFISTSMKTLTAEPWFATVLMMFENPLVAVLIASLFTGLIQSSDATIGILEAFALAGSLTFKHATPLIAGANIGTCVTAIISSVGASKNSKRVAFMNVIINSFTAFLTVTFVIVAGNLPIFSQSISSVQVALVHTFYNILATFLGFLGNKLIISLVKKLVKDESPEFKPVLIDDRLVSRPTIAVNECMNYTREMALISKNAVAESIGLLMEYDEKKYEEIKAMEEKLDWYEDELSTFMIKLSQVSLSQDASEDVGKMMHVITDFERIGDHAYNLAGLAKQMHEKDLAFSPDGLYEVTLLTTAIKEIMDFGVNSFNNDDLAGAAQVEPLEEAIDVLTDSIMDAHIIRLRNGECTIELGMILSEIINNCERISDHCSNVAVCVIEVSDDEFYTHQYLNEIKHQSEAFKALYKYYLEKYSLKS
ncbi:MAG: Na/Pi cotransporter family protein [Erysipelotrichaceae bacterium]|nr:Na/Pi cotransporter family protein [Erysipelotrichaceae bacterium]